MLGGHRLTLPAQGSERPAGTPNRQLKLVGWVVSVDKMRCVLTVDDNIDRRRKRGAVSNQFGRPSRWGLGGRIDLFSNAGCVSKYLPVIVR